MTNVVFISRTPTNVYRT